MLSIRHQHSALDRKSRQAAAERRKRKAESRKREAAFSVTAAGVTVRNLKVRESAGRINVPTTSQTSNRRFLFEAMLLNPWPDRKLKSDVSRKGNHSVY